MKTSRRGFLESLLALPLVRAWRKQSPPIQPSVIRPFEQFDGTAFATACVGDYPWLVHGDGTVGPDYPESMVGVSVIRTERNSDRRRERHQAARARRA